MARSEPSTRQDDYIIDPTSGAEMARLIDLNRLINECMGGLFPQDVDPSTIEDALDLACGPGGWVQDVAFSHQAMQVMGVDSSKAMLDYGRALTRVQRLDNAGYRQMDIRQPLDFAGTSFDFIQARFLATVLSPAGWPVLLAECQRLLRPGGVIRLVEAEWPDTTSPAVQHLGKIVIGALKQLGRSYGPDGQHWDAMERLVPLLSDAGLTQVRRRTVEVPFTTGLISVHPIMDLLRTALYLMEPSLLRWKVTTKEEFEALLWQMELETIGQDFQGTLRIGEAWGKKADPSRSKVR